MPRKNSPHPIPVTPQKPDWRPLPSYAVPLFLSLFFIILLVILSVRQPLVIPAPVTQQADTPVSLAPSPSPVPTLFAFSGIGIRLGNFQENRLVVRQVISGSPAESAGIKPDDFIVKIDGVLATSDIEKAVNQIRGEVGTTVSLVVERQGKYLPFTLTRQQLIDTLPQNCY